MNGMIFLSTSCLCLDGLSENLTLLLALTFKGLKIARQTHDVRRSNRRVGYFSASVMCYIRKLMWKSFSCRQSSSIVAIHYRSGDVGILRGRSKASAELVRGYFHRHMTCCTKALDSAHGGFCTKEWYLCKLCMMLDRRSLYQPCSFIVLYSKHHLGEISQAKSLSATSRHGLCVQASLLRQRKALV